MLDLQPGDQAGPYYIRQKLKEGQGGMAIIYEAVAHPDHRQPGWPEQFAVKVARLEYEDFLKRECEFLARLDHLNVVKVYPVLIKQRHSVYLAREQFRTGGSPYFVMEYIAGGSLEDLLNPKGRGRRKKLDVRRAVHIACRLASALAHIHNQGVIHLDIKPRNILFRRQTFLQSLKARANRLQPILCDFGLARGFGYPPPPAKGGTPDYMSPEQFRESDTLAQQVDYRSDIFSLGVVLYEMLTGQLPFENPGLLLSADLPTAPTGFNLRVSSQLETIVMRCLAKEPHQRYQNASELQRDLVALPLGRGFARYGLTSLVALGGFQ